ncbi:MAG: hypothetical protein IJ856_02970, partial [Candidatus Methanomethylophilaceae archaeon]|nr:hypothetical protein [Candidatus Methanomethylophilaceae archaeon]
MRKDGKPTEDERIEATKDYWRFHCLFLMTIMDLCIVRLQRHSGLSYVEASVWTRWKVGGR